LGAQAAAEGFSLYSAKNQSYSYQNAEDAATYRFFQELKNSKKFKSKLEQSDILSLFNVYSKFDNSRQFALEGENYNVNRLIENVKKFFVDENIPYILNYHFENFDKLNKIFNKTLKIQMSSRMQEEIDTKLFKEEMFKVIHNSYLSFPTDSMFDFFGGKSQSFYYEQSNNTNGFDLNKETGRDFAQVPTKFGINNWDGKGNEFDVKLDKDRVKFCFFFGDIRKIKILIEIIDSKLFLLMKNRFQEKQEGNIERSRFESSYIKF